MTTREGKDSYPTERRGIDRRPTNLHVRNVTLLVLFTVIMAALTCLFAYLFDQLVRIDKDHTPNPISAALHNVIVQKAIAAERATATAVTRINAPDLSQSPLYTEADNISNRKPAVVNGITTTNATEISFSGHGTARGVNYTDNGKALMMPRENGVIITKGYATMTTSSGDKGYATFEEIGHPVVEANNAIAITASGAAFFDSKSTGKLDFLGNAVAIYKDIIYKNGTDIVTAWDWK